MPSRDFHSDQAIVLEGVRKEVIKVVKNDGYMLRFADEKLKADYEIVLAAVKSKGQALEDVYKKFKSDREIVLEALKTDSDAIRFANKILIEKLEQEGLLNK